MATFLHVTLEIKATERARFIDIMKRVIELQTAAGWKLVLGLEQRTGRFHTFIDIWELEDYNHYKTGLEYCFSQPDIEHIVSTLAESVLSETVVFADRSEFTASQAVG